MQWEEWKYNHSRLLLFLLETMNPRKKRQWEALQKYENKRPSREEWQQAKWKKTKRDLKKMDRNLASPKGTGKKNLENLLSDWTFHTICGWRYIAKHEVLLLDLLPAYSLWLTNLIVRIACIWYILSAVLYLKVHRSIPSAHEDQRDSWMPVHTKLPLSSWIPSFFRQAW